MSLTLQKRGKIWHIKGTVVGVKIRESTRLGDRKSAELYKNLRETEIVQRHSLGRAATLTFAEAALTYLEAGGEGRYLRKILDFAGPRTMATEIDNTWINAAAAAIYPTAGPATINRQLITPTAAVLNMAAAEGLTAPRRFRRRKEPPGRTRWLTPDEAERLIDAAEPRIKNLILFLLGSGCRPIEAFQLELDDLHLLTGEAWIWRSKTDTPRMVELPPRSVAALAAIERETGAVFVTPRGGRAYRSDASKGGGQAAVGFNHARDAAGLGSDVTPYTLRHTWATWFYASTGDFGKLLDLGGWTRADTANIYRKIGPADLGARGAAAGWTFDRRTLPPRRAIRAVK